MPEAPDCKENCKEIIEVTDGEKMLILVKRFLCRCASYIWHLISAHLHSNTFWISIVFIIGGVVYDLSQEAPDVLAKFHISKETAAILLVIGANVFKVLQNIKSPQDHEINFPERKKAEEVREEEKKQ